MSVLYICFIASGKQRGRYVWCQPLSVPVRVKWEESCTTPHAGFTVSLDVEKNSNSKLWKWIPSFGGCCFSSVPPCGCVPVRGAMTPPPAGMHMQAGSSPPPPALPLTVGTPTPCRSSASDWLRWAWRWWWTPWRRRRWGSSVRTSGGSSSLGELKEEQGQKMRQAPEGTFL